MALPGDEYSGLCQVASPSQSAEGGGNVEHWLEDAAKATQPVCLELFGHFL